MNIKQVVMHTLHTDENKSILSDQCLEISDRKSFKMIDRKVASVFKSNNRKVSTFQETSNVKKMMNDFKDKKQNFLEMSQELATLLFHVKHQNGIYNSSIFIVCELIFEERHYLVGIDSTLKHAMRLCIREEEGQIINDIEEYKQLFSSAISSKDFVFLYDLTNKELTTIESALQGEKETYNIVSTLFLDAHSEYSYRQGVKMLHAISDQVIEEYDLNPLEVRVKVKQLLYEELKEEEKVEIETVVSTVFEKYPLAKQKMLIECEKVELSNLTNESKTFSKSDQMQKFVTDLGIEIYVPLDYVGNKNVIDIDLGEDELGTITIKNISSIQSK